MGHILLQLAFFFIKIGVAFVPQGPYVEKIKNIPSIESQFAAMDLQGWEYRTIASSKPGMMHRYLYHPGPSIDAPVFLLIHGMNLDARNFLHLGSLAKKYQLLAYDFPDQSPFYNGSLDGFTLLLQEFLQKLDVRDLHIAGVSFGGVVALRLAANSPALNIRSLVLASSGVVGTNEQERKRNKNMGAWVASLKDYQVYWVMEKITTSFMRNLSKNDAKAISSILRLKHPTFYRQVVASTGGYDASIDARSLKCPVLVLVGSKDEIFPPGDTIAVRANIPAAQIQIVPGATHAMTFVAATDIGRRIENFTSAHFPNNH